jgi:hypothetical protein
MKRSQVDVDPILSVEGVDIPYGEPEDGKQTTFKIAYGDNPNYRRKLAKLSARAGAQIAGRTLPPEAAMNLNRAAMAGTVLVGWTNWDDDDGNPIPFSEAEALKTLEVAVVDRFIQYHAGLLEHFQRQKEAASDAEIKSGADVGTETRQGPESVESGGGSGVRDTGTDQSAAA